MDLCTGGELIDTIVEDKSFEEVKAAKIMKKILSAVNYLHRNKIAHCDLKPENILFESKNSDIVKIIDFGTSQLCEKS